MSTRELVEGEFDLEGHEVNYGDTDVSSPEFAAKMKRLFPGWEHSSQKFAPPSPESLAKMKRLFPGWDHSSQKFAPPTPPEYGLSGKTVRIADTHGPRDAQFTVCVRAHPPRHLAQQNGKFYLTVFSARPEPDDDWGANLDPFMSDQVVDTVDDIKAAVERGIAECIAAAEIW